MDPDLAELVKTTCENVNLFVQFCGWFFGAVLGYYFFH